MGDHLQNPVPTNPISPEAASKASGFFANVTKKGKDFVGKVEKEGRIVKGSIGEDFDKQGAKFQGFKGDIMAFKASKTAEAKAALDGIKANQTERINEAKADLATGGIHARGAKALGTFRKWGKRGVERYDQAVAPGGDIDRAKADFKQGKEQAEAEAKAKAEASAPEAESLESGSGGGRRRRRRRKSRKKRRKSKRKSRKRRKSRKKKRKRKTRKKRRRRNHKKSRRRRRR